jgi:hypothetical protein
VSKPAVEVDPFAGAPPPEVKAPPPSKFGMDHRRTSTACGKRLS